MFGARGVSSVTLGSLPPVLLALALGRRVSRKSACKDRSSLGSISRFVSARQLDLVCDRDNRREKTREKTILRIAADANKQRSAAGSDEVDWEAIARTRRSVREYLDTLDEAACGAASETVPKFISKSDPAAQWTGAHKGHAFFAYANNYLIDRKVAIIVDVEPTRAIRQAEVGAARTMIERTEERLGVCPERVAADRAYGTAEMLSRVVKHCAF